MTSLPRALTLVLAAHAVAAPAVARQQADSETVLHAARRAQAGYEDDRRRRLPYGYGHAGGPCEEPIGRFCYWYDDDPGPALPEPQEIGDARARLLVTLQDAARAIPGDAWVAGQRVRYLIEAGDPRAAVVAAGECGAAVWWCAALAGLAHHVAGDVAAADSAFDAALHAMPDEERCRWTDLSQLLSGELRRRYQGLGSDARATFEARWWWLTTPLLSLPANDRRTEHFARLTLARVERDSRTTYGLSWGDDLDEILTRFGWPTWWTQEPSTSVTAPAPLVAGHEPTPAFQFAPAAHAFDDPGSATPADWTLEARHARERYAPGYAAVFAPLEHQAAVFRRGDSCVVVAAYDLADDLRFTHQAAEAALVLAPDPGTRVAVRHRTRLDGPDTLVATTGCAPQILSLEVVAVRGHRAARARYGIAPGAPGARVAVSDVLLFDPPDSLPMELGGVLPHALGSDHVRVDRKLGLFWETYGLAPGGETVTTALALTADRGGWLRRAAVSVGLAAPRRAVELRWEDVLRQRDGVAPRALALDLSGVARGRYRLEVSVRVAGTDSVTATREIEVVRR